MGGASQDLSGFEGPAPAGPSPVKRSSGLLGATAAAPPRQPLRQRQPAKHESAALHRALSVDITPGAAAPQRPAGATLLALPSGAENAEPVPAPTPAMQFGRRPHSPQAAAVGQPKEQWSPICVQEVRSARCQSPGGVRLPTWVCAAPPVPHAGAQAVAELYDSDEEATPRPSVLNTVKRMFGRRKCRQCPLRTPLACPVRGGGGGAFSSPACLPTGLRDAVRAGTTPTSAGAASVRLPPSALRTPGASPAGAVAPSSHQNQALATIDKETSLSGLKRRSVPALLLGNEQTPRADAHVPRLARTPAAARSWCASERRRARPSMQRRCGQCGRAWRLTTSVRQPGGGGGVSR